MSIIEQEFIVGKDEVHIWDFKIEPDKKLAEIYFNSLSETEKNKVNNIKIRDVKYRSIISKFITRNILSKYLGWNTSQILIDYNEFGKPVIAREINSNNLNFNISHSVNMGILALTKEKLIGIDLEQVVFLNDLEDLINLYFNEYEINVLSGLENPDKTKIFYKIWTGKEAFVKAIGLGLTFPLKNIAFDFDSETGLTLRYIKEYSDSFTKWKIYNFNPQKNYTSSLAVNNDSFEIKRFNLNQIESDVN